MSEGPTEALDEGSPAAEVATATRGRGGGVSQLAPGTVLAGRYRIVAPLGRGGMGEVYRAEDLRLGETVALKFLAPELARDRAALERLYGEVRLGRRVSHPNVCRIHDLVESDEAVFITMEYVDGEDLASLLRRIGRVPPDKALALLRELCAGLAAVHDNGLVHRDLKPANVLVDGNGRARLTDFGVAVAARDLTGSGDLAGTLAYMAPEQLGRAETSARSDLYSLGLVAYEMVTGRRPFTAGSLGELVMQQHGEVPTAPSLLASGLDQRLDALVLRCLEKDPAARPRSARELLQALPGGDPLQAAIAAGETPSPEMVAAAEKTGELRPAVAGLLLAGALVGLLALAALSDRTRLFRLVGPLSPPDVLVARAEELLRMAGVEATARDRFAWFDEAAGREAERMPRTSTVAALRPGVFRFHYRRSAAHLAPRAGQFSTLLLPGYSRLGRVTRNDPALEAAGDAEVVLTPAGDLVELRVFPRAGRSVAAGVTPRERWLPLLAATGLATASLREEVPQWVPAMANDERRAWSGRYPSGRQDVRVEAAAFAGRPVWLRVLGPWMAGETADAPSARGASVPADDPRIALLFGVLAAGGTLVALVVGSLLAMRNARRGRGDLKGGFRLASFCFAVLLLAGLVRIHHQASPEEEILLLLTLLGQAVFMAALAWMLYLSVEPYCRRRWPESLIGCTRLLTGRWRDPLVGRDVLVGVVAGTALGTLVPLAWLADGALGVQRSPLGIAGFTLSRLADHLFLVFYLPYPAIATSIALVFWLVLLRTSLRREWLARLALLALLIVTYLAVVGTAGSALPCSVLLAAGTTWLFVRHGALASAVSTWVQLIAFFMPLTLDAEAWYFGRSAALLALLLALAAWGARTSLGAGPLWRGGLLEA